MRDWSSTLIGSRLVGHFLKMRYYPWAIFSDKMSRQGQNIYSNVDYHNMETPVRDDIIKELKTSMVV
jgi:hypothetical protein